MHETDVYDLGDGKQLFVDDRWFDSQHGISLTVNPPMKSDFVIVQDRPWETKNIGAYSTFIDDEGVLKLWYDGRAPKRPEANHPCLSEFICYAESSDGIEWERKNVNLFPWEGHTENNIVVPAAHGAVMKDPKAPDEHRFKGTFRIWPTDLWPESTGCIAPRWEDGSFISDSVVYLCTSPDGVHWKKIGAVSDGFHDSHNQLGYDRRIDKYVAYFRTHARGRTVGRLEMDDAMEVPWIPLGKDRSETYKNFTTAISADDADPPDVDLYTPCVQQYPWADDAYFAFTTPYRHYPVGDTGDTTLSGKDTRGRYKNDGPVDVQLAVSRDGVLFSRPDRKPYVPLGLPGSDDAGQAYMCLGMIRRGDEIYQYYSGTTHTHGAYDPEAPSEGGGIRRLIQRLDGFMSADAAYGGADFTTPLLRFTGARLKLNVDCSALGQVWVEIRDEKNHPIPGYSMDEAVYVDRNDTAAEVVWRDKSSVAELAGRPVRLHVKARACKLYAFQFAADE